MAGHDGSDGGARHSDGRDVDGSGSGRSGDAWRRPKRRTESPPHSIGIVRSGGPPLCGGNPLSGVTRPPGMSRGRVVNSHATPP